jgi:hypothetical protein
VAADLKACHIVLVNRISRGINIAGGGVMGERRRDRHRGTKDQEAQVYLLLREVWKYTFWDFS